MTANLQTRLTIKQAARIMNVSERSVYKASVVRRERPDLGEAVMSQRLSLDAAYQMCRPHRAPPPGAKLILAWSKATLADIEAFTLWLQEKQP